MSLFDLLKNNNIKIAETINFPDHYNYSNKDITTIKETAKNFKTKKKNL